MTREATISEVRDFFGYTATRDFMNEWKELPASYKQYFKEAVGAELESNDS